MARIDAVLAIGVVAGWLALVFALNITALPTPRIVRSAQTLQWLGVVTIIPAILGLFGAMKRRAG